jgi:type IV pilus assembly protein PilC
LRDFPNVFDDLYVSLVVAGEEGGMLDSILNRHVSLYREVREAQEEGQERDDLPVCLS